MSYYHKIQGLNVSYLKIAFFVLAEGGQNQNNTHNENLGQNEGLYSLCFNS